MMFCSSRIKKLGIIAAIIIIIIALVKVCYVCEEGFVSGSFTREEAKTHFLPDTSHRGSEKNYLADKIYIHPTLRENLEKNIRTAHGEPDWEAINKVWEDIMEQPNSDASRTRLLQIAEKNGVKEKDLGLYAKQDFIEQYAMRAYELPAKFVNGMPTENSNKKQKEMYLDIEKSTSVDEAKQKYEKYAKVYPPIDFSGEEHHNKVKDSGFCAKDPTNPTYYIAKTANKDGWMEGDTCYKQGGGTTGYGEGQCVGGTELSGCIEACDKEDIACQGVTSEINANFECSEKVCDTGYNYRGTKDFTVRTSEGRVILLVEEIKPAIIQTLKHQGIYDDLNIMKEIVHNWMFEIKIDGTYTKFSPLMRCNHDYGQDHRGKETIEIKTFPPSKFSDGRVDTQSISWYQCGGPKSPSREESEARVKAIAEENAKAEAKAKAYEEAKAKAYEEAKAKADAEAAAKIKGNAASEPAGGTFAPHDQVGSILDENDSPFEKLVDNNTVIDPPGILGPSSLTPPDSRPVNIIITSNVGPYGLVTNPRKPQEISYSHELGDKTNTQVNKTMSFMEHVMNTSQQR